MTSDRPGSRMLAANASVAGRVPRRARFGAVPARTLRAMGLLVAILASACHHDDGCCWIELSPMDPEVRGHPGQPGDWNGALEDSAGLAGIEIEVRGRTFFAEDFLDDPNRERRVMVERVGRVAVFAKLVQGGSLVAEGVASWTLEPNAFWTLDIVRGPEDTGVCFEWCDGHVVIPIAKTAARYPGESLWLNWTAWPHKPEPGVVYNSPSSP